MKPVAIPALAAALLVATPVGAGEKISLRVMPTITAAPASVRVTAQIERDPANRYVDISADSGDFYRSSRISLEGDQAPLVTEVALRNLPGGNYTISVTLVDNLGRSSTKKQSLIVVAPPTER